MGGRGAGYSLTGSGEESKGTKKSKAKLAALQASFDAKFNDHVNNMRARPSVAHRKRERPCREE